MVPDGILQLARLRRAHVVIDLEKIDRPSSIATKLQANTAVVVMRLLDQICEIRMRNVYSSS